MDTMERIADELKRGFGARLRVLAVYGSAARGNRTPKFSDVNLLIVLDRVDGATLNVLEPLFRRWIRQGNKPPVILAESEIARSQDVFALELADIRDHHQLLAGDAAVLSSIEIRPSALRRQLEFELRSKQMLLRQAFIAAGGRPRALEEAMARSLSSVSALFRGLMRVLGEPVTPGTPEMLRHLQERLAIDAEAWEVVWRWRHGERLPRVLSAAQIFDRLLAGLQKAVDFVDADARDKEEK